MQPTRWPTFSVKYSATPQEFVRFWQRLYSGYDEVFYQENIVKTLTRGNIAEPHTKERIAKWFEWKNGTTLSAKKAKSILRYLDPDELLSVEADPAALKAFLNRPGGAIWRIFWLHIQHPKRFPIYDQHAHRAMAFLRKLPQLEISKNDPKKVQAYLDDYCPFVQQFADCDQREVDRALWTFGRFLSVKPQRVFMTEVQ